MYVADHWDGTLAMAGFSADWLALREAADHAARSVAVTVAVTRAVVDALPRDTPLRILDLAAGTGSNLRYLASHIDGVGAGPRVCTGPTHGSAPTTPHAITAPSAAADPRACPEPGRTVRPNWLLVDHDPALLAQVPKTPGVNTHCTDLSTLGDREIFDGRALVTASALLDLVSEDWLRALATRCADGGAAVLFALSYDGRIGCSPEDPADAAIAALVNEHQRTDKGFGPALGPGATDCAERCFAAFGYLLQRARSDWALPPESRALQQQLIDGWAKAATEIAPSRTVTIDGWRNRRLAHVEANRSRIIVGHEDFAAWLPRNLRR